MSPDEITPNAAPRVAHALGAERAAAFDIGAACTGFLAGLAQAAAMIEVGRAERILLIGAEKLTRITDFDDKKTGMLFGDGAGAVVLGPTESGTGIGPIDLTADGGLGDTIVATPEDPFIRMDGISTFKIAIKRLSRVDDLRRLRRRASSSTTSTCSSTTRPTRGSSRRSASGSSSTRPRSPTTSPSSATRRAASIPLTLSLSPRGRPPAARAQGARRRDRGGLHLGRRRDGVERI